MKARQSDDSPNLGFQIAPMIDVVFVIMLFFMVMTGAMKTERELRVSLPTCPSDVRVKMPDQEVFIEVDEDGLVTLNGENFDGYADKSLPGLSAAVQRLKQLVEATSDTLLVTVMTANETRYERLVDVLNVLTRAGIKDVSFGIVSDT